MHNSCEGQLYTEEKAIFASSYMELEKGEEMQKSTAIVEPNIIKTDSFVIETQTGKTIEVVNIINPNDWIGMEYEARKERLARLKGDVFNNSVKMFGATLFICLFGSNMPIYDLMIGTLAILDLLVLICGLGAIKTVSKRVKSFMEKMEEGVLTEDMNKTIDMRFGYHKRNCVYSILRLRHEKVYDISFEPAEDKSVMFEVLTLDTNGTINIWHRTCMDVIRNINIECPRLVISTDGIKLEFPIEEKIKLEI